MQPQQHLSNRGQHAGNDQSAYSSYPTSAPAPQASTAPQNTGYPSAPYQPMGGPGPIPMAANPPAQAYGNTRPAPSNTRSDAEDVKAQSAQSLAAGGIWTAAGPHRASLTTTYLIVVLAINFFFLGFFDLHEIVDSSGYFAIQKQFLFSPFEWYRFIAYTFFIPSLLHLVVIVPAMAMIMRRLESHVGSVSLMDGYVICSITAAVGSCLIGNARFVYVYGPMGAVCGMLGVVHALGLRTWRTLRSSAFERKQSIYRANTNEVVRSVSVLIHLGLLSFTLPSTLTGLAITLVIAAGATVALVVVTKPEIKSAAFLFVAIAAMDAILGVMLWENTVVPYRLYLCGYLSGLALGSLIWSPEKDEEDSLSLPIGRGDSLAGAMRGHSVRNRLSQFFTLITVIAIVDGLGTAVWNWDHHDYDCQRIVRMLTLTHDCIHPTHGHIRTATEMHNLYDVQNLDLLERLVEQSARNRDIVRHMSDDEGMAAVVDRMSCENRDVHLTAVSILGHLTRHHAATRERIAHLNGITPLVNLLKTGDVMARREAGRTLGNLALSDENEVHVAGLGGLEPLIDLLKSKDTTACVVACDSLFNLAFNQQNKKLIKTMGGIRPAVIACRRSEEQVQVSAAQLLGNLAMDDQNEKEIVRLGGMECLLEQMRDGTPNVQQHAAAALYVMSFDDDSKKRIAKNDGVHILLHLVMTSAGGTGEQVVLNAVKTLSVLALDADAAKIIAEAGGIDVLVRELDADLQATQVFAAKALRNLALNDDFEHSMVEAGALTSFLRLANDDSEPEGQAIAGGALHVISFHEDHRHAMAALEGVEIAVKLCYSPEANVQLVGIRLLQQLCLEPEYAKTADRVGARSCLRDRTQNLDDDTIAKEAEGALKLLEIDEEAPAGQHFGSLDGGI